MSICELVNFCDGCACARVCPTVVNKFCHNTAAAAIRTICVLIAAADSGSRTVFLRTFSMQSRQLSRKASGLTAAYLQCATIANASDQGLTMAEADVWACGCNRRANLCQDCAKLDRRFLTSSQCYNAKRGVPITKAYCHSVCVCLKIPVHLCTRGLRCDKVHTSFVHLIGGSRTQVGLCYL
eukprot:365467-Chlamydomonas_euryale.AAC.25